MRSPSNYSMIIGLFLLINGCSSGIRVSQDYEPSTVFSNLNTYALKLPIQSTNVDRRLDNPLIEERIHKALTKTLSEKGFTPVSTQPDFWVIYQYVIRTKISSDSSGSGMSVGVGMGARNRSSSLFFGTGTGISQYDEGNLIIDIEQGDTGKLIWRGTSRFGVEAAIEPEKMTETINMAVKKNLDQFPPKRE